MKNKFIVSLCLAASLFLSACSVLDKPQQETRENLNTQAAAEESSTEASLKESRKSSVPEEAGAQIISDIPAYVGDNYVVLNDNIPGFQEADITTDAFEKYSDLDALGRCGAAFANVCKEIMPTEERGQIGAVKPSGWHTVKYDIVDGKYLYNRCHLIGYQLAGENANEKNLITGTRWFNTEGMLPFENQVADYVQETGNHVLYRVTPFYDGDNLVAKGVEMEAFSVEDHGEGICFNVFVYNIQPGIEIDYATGESWLQADSLEEPEAKESGSGEDTEYVLNTKSMKFHYPNCSGVSTMSDKNKEVYYGTREELLEKGYSPCGTCKP